MRYGGQEFVLQAVDVFAFPPQNFFTRQKFVALILDQSFALPALMNVQTIAYVTNEHPLNAVSPINPFRIEQRRAVTEDTTISAVMPPQPVLHSKLAMAVECLIVYLKSAPEVLRL